MARHILSKVGNTTTYFHDSVDGKGAIETVADVTPSLERAKALHNAGRVRTGMGNRHVASIPVPVIEAWARKRGLMFRDVMQNQDLFSRFLSDPDNGYFIIDKASV